MPRLYVSTTDFLLYPVALTFTVQVARLQALSGALDRLLATASRRVDMRCRKRLLAPPTTTVGTGGIASGSTSLPVTSTLGFDGDKEQAVIIGTGGTQETVPLLPGGVQVSAWSGVYPGTLQLAQPVAFTHNAGEAVQGCYQEVSTVGSSGSSDVYSESLLELNQAAQLARAHAPQFDTSGLTRVIFVKQYPVVKLFKLEHMLPIDTSYETLDASQVGIHPSAGYLRLPIGSFVLPEGLFRSTYTAGYQVVPDEIAYVTTLYAADELQKMVNMGASEMSQGKLRGKYRDGSKPGSGSNYVQDAEKMLCDGGYVRRT